jgi:hypothetical protein
MSLRKWVVDTLNGMIDYLHSARVRPGNGILIRETPSGTIIELKKQPDSPQSSGGGGSAQDISATVSGGTATIEISGSTSAVEIVGGTSGNVTISGNTNGQVVIDATGGGGGAINMPDYSAYPFTLIHVFRDTYSHTFTEDVALVGSFGTISGDTSGLVTMSIGDLDFEPFATTGTSTSLAVTVPAFFLIPSGTLVVITAQSAAAANLYIVPLA